MTKHVLEGGSQLSELALFSCDQLPAKAGRSIDAMAASGQAMRIATDSDARQRLHLFVDEEIPDRLAAWLDADDTLEYRFVTETGRVAFGGVESITASFTANDELRNDVDIPPGAYQATAFHTDYPAERLEEAMQYRIGSRGVRLVNRPANIFTGSLLLFISMVILGVAGSNWYFAAAAAVALGAWGWTRLVIKSKKYRDYMTVRRDVERSFPSIVISLERDAPA